MFKSLKQFAKKLAGGSKRTRKVSQKGGATLTEDKVGKLNIKEIEKGMRIAVEKGKEKRIGQIKHNRTHGRAVGKGSMPNPTNSRNVKKYGNTTLVERNVGLYKNGSKLETWQEKKMSQKFGAKGHSRKNHVTGSNRAYFALKNTGNTAYNVLGKEARKKYAYATNISNGNLIHNNRGNLATTANENFYTLAMQNNKHSKMFNHSQPTRKSSRKSPKSLKRKRSSSPDTSPRKSSKSSSPSSSNK